MEAKDKAFELVKNYVNIINPDSLKGMPVSENDEMMAKKCAKIAIELTISELNKLPSKDLQYWSEVEKEIKFL